MRNLILITSEFPYYSSEPFLINELPFLSETFDEIFIFSINASTNDKPTRNVPKNAKFFPLDEISSKAKYVKYAINGLSNANEEVKIKLLSPKKVIASLYTRGRAVDIAERIYRIIQKKKLNVNNVTVYSFWFAYQAVAAWMLSDKLKNDGCHTYTVARAHGYDLYWERATGGFLPFQDSSLKKMDKCFPCSEYGTRYLLKKYPWAKQKIRTSRLGTKDYGLNPYKGEKTLITCCNLEPLKRMYLFAQAFCKLAKADAALKWICIGAGEEDEIIRNLIQQAGISKQVTMTGRLPNDRVMEIYKSEGAMFFCNVSTSEGLPVSIMEAMSFGIPIIATDVGGTSELVDESNGILLDSNINEHQLTRSIKKMVYSDSNYYFKLRDMARVKWQNTVSATENYNEFCRMLCPKSESIHD